MQKLIIAMLAVSMTSLPAKAQNRSCSTNNSKLEACDKALKAADEVIRKQGEVLRLVSQQNVELKDENQQLSDALVQLKSDYDSEIKNGMVIGGAGLLLGVLIGILVPR